MLSLLFFSSFLLLSYSYWQLNFWKITLVASMSGAVDVLMILQTIENHVIFLRLIIKNIDHNHCLWNYLSYQIHSLLYSKPFQIWDPLIWIHLNRFQLTIVRLNHHLFQGNSTVSIRKFWTFALQTNLNATFPDW